MQTPIFAICVKVRPTQVSVGSGFTAAHSSLAAKILRIPHIAAKIPHSRVGNAKLNACVVVFLKIKISHNIHDLGNLQQITT